jgi:hypothetical protein
MREEISHGNNIFCIYLIVSQDRATLISTWEPKDVSQEEESLLRCLISKKKESPFDVKNREEDQEITF